MCGCGCVGVGVRAPPPPPPSLYTPLCVCFSLCLFRLCVRVCVLHPCFTRGRETEAVQERVRVCLILLLCFARATIFRAARVCVALEPHVKKRAHKTRERECEEGDREGWGLQKGKKAHALCLRASGLLSCAFRGAARQNEDQGGGARALVQRQCSRELQLVPQGEVKRVGIGGARCVGEKRGRRDRHQARRKTKARVTRAFVATKGGGDKTRGVHVAQCVCVCVCDVFFVQNKKPEGKVQTG